MRTTGSTPVRALARAISIISIMSFVFGLMPSAWAGSGVLTAVLTPSDKTYDRTTAATATCSVTADEDYDASDDVGCSVTTASFALATVGTREVTATVALTGDDAGSYSLEAATITGSAEILTLGIDATLTADDKVYDGTTDADAECNLTGILGGDTVNCVVDSASFGTAAVGTDKTVTATVSLDGTDAGNYVLNDDEVTDLADILAATTTVAYTGQTYIVTSGSSAANLSAAITTDASVCELDDLGAIAFAVKDVFGSPIAGSPFAGTASATSASATTGALAPGIYTIDITYTSSDPTTCPGNSDAAVLTIVTAGGSANGGGWYRRGDYTGEGSARANFGFVLNKTYTGTGKNRTVSGYKGQFVWVSGEGWRIKATLSGGLNYFGTFTCPTGVGATGSGAVCGSFLATGTLEMWDPSLNGGLGDWSSMGDVDFTVTVYDGGTVTVCKKKVCTKTDVADWFGIQIDGYSYAEVPETEPMKLLPSDGKGSIKATF